MKAVRPYLAIWKEWRNVSISAGWHRTELGEDRKRGSFTQNFSLIKEYCRPALKTHCLTCNVSFFTKSTNLILYHQI